MARPRPFASRHENERSESKIDGLGTVSRRIPSKNQEILKMVPKLTAEQRRAALDKGMQIRLKRAEYKARLKNGLMSIEQFFELADGGEQAALGMRVESLIRSMPGYAVPRTETLMKSLHISESRRVMGLGYVQREGLIKALGGGCRE
ncbi:MAG: integration host factor, actinobacterial type [Collinsella sp.]